MKAAVRYYSRTGNTKELAGAIAKGAGVQAVSVDSADAPIRETVDVLFIGGALYAYGIDGHLKDYLRSLKAENVKKAVIFSTSWISKHAIDLIRKELSEKGIRTAEEVFYAKNRPNEKQLLEAVRFAGKYL